MRTISDVARVERAETTSQYDQDTGELVTVSAPRQTNDSVQALEASFPQPD